MTPCTVGLNVICFKESPFPVQFLSTNGYRISKQIAQSQFQRNVNKYERAVHDIITSACVWNSSTFQSLHLFLFQVMCLHFLCEKAWEIVESSVLQTCGCSKFSQYANVLNKKKMFLRRQIWLRSQYVKFVFLVANSVMCIMLKSWNYYRSRIWLWGENILAANKGVSSKFLNACIILSGRLLTGHLELVLSLES